MSDTDGVLLPPPAVAFSQSYVAGGWVTGGTAFTVENPADESIVAEPTATPMPEVRRAIHEAPGG